MSAAELRGNPLGRFFSHVEPGTCWVWTASRSGGYGQFHPDARRPVPAHRWLYEILVGPVPAGLELDHVCRNRACVNPAHLEPVTHRENCRRGEPGHRATRWGTHCPRGHPYSGDNLGHDASGYRRCRTCRRASGRQYQQRRRAALRAA
ncbi:MAG: HNH endonuclease [Chloroflexota bacterium]|nr:MAG: HNH endonuclease [Chloroflexota bacterium]